MDKSLLISIGLTVGVPALCAIIMRLLPKGKAIEKMDKMGEAHGVIASKLGNSKVGKKAMDSIEEGPITTGIAMLMAYFVGFGRGMRKDNGGL